MLSCWEAGQPTSAPRAASQHHRARTRDRQAWSAKRPFPSRIFLSSLAALGAWESNSATRPVSGILSRWWWTGGWTGRLGREWWLVPDYTSGGWVPFSSSSTSSSSSSCHMPGMAMETGCSPVLVLQWGVKLFISDMTWCCGSAVKVRAIQTLRQVAAIKWRTKMEKMWPCKVMICLLLQCVVLFDKEQTYWRKTQQKTCLTVIKIKFDWSNKLTALLNSMQILSSQ